MVIRSNYAILRLYNFLVMPQSKHRYGVVTRNRTLGNSSIHNRPIIFKKPKGTLGQKLFSARCALCWLLEWLDDSTVSVDIIAGFSGLSGCTVEGSSWIFSGFQTNCTYSESFKSLVMLHYVRYSEHHLTTFLTFDISYIVTLVWTLKGLRNWLVARGRKRLCTTGLYCISYIILEYFPKLFFWSLFLRNLTVQTLNIMFRTLDKAHSKANRLHIFVTHFTFIQRK